MKRGEQRLSSLSEKYGTDSQEYKDALRNITLKNVWYKDMVNTTTKQLAEVNQTALAYVQDQMPEVYALNYNQFGRELEKAGISDEDSIRFNLVDEATVRRMIKDGDIEMPYQKKRLSIPKDQRWNTRQINSSVLQGIIQGESIGQIAKRLYPIMDNNVHAAVRNARTLVTGAESRGRMDSYKEAKDDGVVLNKVWLATADGRTRDWHVDMDGQEVGVDEEFTDGLGNALMYPGDPGGAPESVYNCRCALTTHIVGFQRADGSISYVDYEGEPDAHDRAMEKERDRRGLKIQPRTSTAKTDHEEEKKKLPLIMSKLKAMLRDSDYTEFSGKVEEADNRELFRVYADGINGLTEARSGGYYTPALKSITFSYDSNDGTSRYSTLAHEYNHYFDAVIGRADSLSFKEADLINDKCKFGSGAMRVIKECPSNSDEFLSALRTDMGALKSRGLKELYAEFRQSTESRNATGSVQDALDGFYSTQKQYAGWGHGDKYYNRKYNNLIKDMGNEKSLKECYIELGFDASNQTKVKRICRQYEAASEAFANVGSAVACGGKELEAVEKYMPNTVAAYREIAGGLNNDR